MSTFEYSDLKVAVLNRPRHAWPGGDVVHIDELSSALSLLGVHRAYFDAPPNREVLELYDVIHIYHVNFQWSENNFEAVKTIDKPVVLTAIYYPHIGINRSKIRQYLERCSRIVCYSMWEAKEMGQETGYSGRCAIIPPGVSSEFYAKDEHGERPKQVMTAAARMGDKNVNRVKECCSNLNLECTVATQIGRPVLPKMYKEHKVFVNASSSERFGLTILEGLAAGCRVLATKYSRGLEHLPGIYQIDPHSWELEQHIKKAYFGKDWDFTPNKAARNMSWLKAAESYRQLYGEVL